MNKDGQLNFYNLNTGKIKYTYSPVLLENETIVSSNSFAGDLDRILALGTSSGRILSFKLKFKLKIYKQFRQNCGPNDNS